MPSFPILDGFECANPRGLVRFGNPLPAKPGSDLRAGDEIAKRKRPLSVAVGNMNDSSAKLEIRHSFDELAHSDLFRLVTSGGANCAHSGKAVNEGLKPNGLAPDKRELAL